jgi:hypothetical protein
MLRRPGHWLQAAEQVKSKKVKVKSNEPDQ